MQHDQRSNFDLIFCTETSARQFNEVYLVQSKSELPFRKSENPFEVSLEADDNSEIKTESPKARLKLKLNEESPGKPKFSDTLEC